jgi:hypothetical protein
MWIRLLDVFVYFNFEYSISNTLKGFKQDTINFL